MYVNNCTFILLCWFHGSLRVYVFFVFLCLCGFCVYVFFVVFTPHVQRERGKVICCGVHIYIYICLWTKKNLNRTLEIDSPFQTFTVGL